MVGAKSNNIRCVQITSNQPAQWDKIINFAKEFDEWYYIFHDKDLDETGELKRNIFTVSFMTKLGPLSVCGLHVGLI